MAFKMNRWSAFKKETNLPEEEQQRISDAKSKGKFMKKVGKIGRKLSLKPEPNPKPHELATNIKYEEKMRRRRKLGI